MGHKKNLLEGAKKCLLELGYARTTARDIVAASGTNLASIGYHFGSKDALMTEAIISLVGEWGERFDIDRLPADATYRERFTGTWQALIDAIDSEPKMAIASFENFTSATRQPALAAIVGKGQDQARQAYGDDFVDSAIPASEQTKKAIGGLMLAITSGIIAQRLIDPVRSPSAEDILTAFDYVGAALRPDLKP